MKLLHFFFIFPILLAIGCGSSAAPSGTAGNDVAQRDTIQDKGPAFDGHIYLPATIRDSVQGEFVFDTGASDLYLDSLFHVRKLSEAMPAGKGMIGGVGGKMQAVRILLEPFAFTLPSGNYQSSKVTPLLRLKEILGRRVDGIVGQNFFKGKYIAINYRDGSFKATDSPDTTGYRRIPLLYRDGRLFLEGAVSVAGKTIEGTFLLDTGSGGSADFTSHAAQKYGLPDAGIEKSAYRNTSGGIGGESHHVKCIAQEVVLDTFRLKDIGIAYSQDKAGSLASEKYDGLIGNQVLSRFDVIIDLKDMNLFLRPNADYGKPFKNYGHGILYVDRTDIYDGFVVTGMRVGGEAEKAGLKENDILVAIDSAPLKELSRKEVNKLLNDTEKPHVLSVQRNGEALELNYQSDQAL